MSFKTIVLICAWMLLTYVLTEAKVIKLSVDEMSNIKGVGCPPLTPFCREECKPTGEGCGSKNNATGSCYNPGDYCYWCENPGSEETCASICTWNPFQSCTWDTPHNCGLKKKGLCTYGLVCVGPWEVEGNCGTVTQCT